MVNGAPTNSITYTSAGKIRAVLVTTAQSEGSGRVSPLAALDAARSQNRQPLTFQVGMTGSVAFEIVSVYEGQGVYDLERNPPRWILPEGRTAMAEVEFYVAV